MDGWKKAKRRLKGVKMFQKEILKTKDKVILVVDDNKDNIDLIEEVLSEEGYKNLLVASSGPEALSIAKGKKPDLMLLDIMMPYMDGYEVCNVLKDSEETADMPIIMITAKTTAEDLKRGFEVGAFDYIKKPFDELELLARVQSALKLKQSRDELKKKNIGLSYLTQQYRAAIDALRQEISDHKELEEELQEEVAELERYKKIAADQERQIVELKQEIKIIKLESEKKALEEKIKEMKKGD